MHFCKNYGTQTCQDRDLGWGDLTHQVRWTFDHAVTEQIKSVLSALCFVFYLTHMVSSVSSDILILQFNGKESIGVVFWFAGSRKFLFDFWESTLLAANWKIKKRNGKQKSLSQHLHGGPFAHFLFTYHRPCNENLSRKRKN